jgi:hypothetical protein
MSAWIGTALTVEGKVISTQDLTIDGVVEGTIELGNHGLNIGSAAKIKADLVAKTITISGTVKGNVTATSIVDLRATGSVEATLRRPPRQRRRAPSSTVMSTPPANERDSGNRFRCGGVDGVRVCAPGSGKRGGRVLW